MPSSTRCIALFAAALIGVTAAAPTAEFKAWKTDFSKVYKTVEEEAARFAIWAENKITVEAHNAANHSWTMAMNQFADLTEAEFAERNGLRYSESPNVMEFVAPAGDIATSMDWRTKGLVNDVKNQGGCGSCWAFSTIVAFEGQYAKKNSLTSFSEQDLVDCVKDVEVEGQACCDGCQGGLMTAAFSYIVGKQSGKDNKESDYSYKGSNGKCKFDSGAALGGFTNFTTLPAGDETALKQAVATIGPISVGVDANMGWQLYHGGVMDPWPIIGCSNSPKKMDHGVAVVGYGSDGGKDYWIVRNSWGATWGEKGYIRLVAGKNACGVANSASYPTM